MNEENMESKKMHFDFFKLAVLAISAIYFLDIAFRYENNWCFIDGMNLWIHEAGHFFFMIFGSEFLTIAGGTVFQLLFPLMFIIYFYYTEQKFSAALTVFWLGENFIDISVYMADAVDMVLPLINSEGTEGHDWHNMFSMLGLLSHTETLATATRMLGALIIFFAIGWGIMLSRKSGEEA